VRGQEFVIEASIGVTVSDVEAVDADELLRRADVALYRAKASAGAQALLFYPAMDQEAAGRTELESDLRRALERGELQLEYQPEVQLASGAIAGFEALLRWQHPKRGTLPPTGFLPSAEETGLIVPIGDWALEEACRQAMRVRAVQMDGRPLTMSVNLTEQQLELPDLAARISNTLSCTGLEPGLLRLEITENIMMRDVDGTLQTLHALKALGVQVAIDDFGTGYSSLGYLHRFALDALKIDQSFMRGLGQDKSTDAIVQAIIALAHAVGMRVIAEGVETEEQATSLLTLDCDYGQGFYLGHPVTGNELDALLRA
jgi:EAL domain-containing protein (putative c-di-GMP-specific phosphodiesterase class I)